MCSCTTHRWLARPVTPQAGDQAVAGQAQEHADAVGHCLAAALAVYDRRAADDDRAALLIEVAVDDETAAWIPITPVDGHLPQREAVVGHLETLLGRLLADDTPAVLPALPAGAIRVDLDAAPAGDVVTPRTPGWSGPSPWS